MANAPTNEQLYGMIEALRNTLQLVVKQVPGMAEELANRKIVPNPGNEPQQPWIESYLQTMEKIRLALGEK